MMDGIKKKINYDPALLYFSNKTDEEKPNPIPISTTETYDNTNRKHGCKICGKRFFTISSLNSHIEHHNLNELKNTSSENDHLEERRKLKKGTQFVCRKIECNFVALDTVEFQKHTIICEGKRLTKDSVVAFCEHCENHFSSTSHLHAHTALKHSDSDISLNECRIKQIVSDPLCLYVSENTDGENSSKNPTMYPGPEHASFSKKKMKEAEYDDSSNTREKRSSHESDDSGKNETVEGIHETLANGIHRLNDNESESPENNFENRETETFNCDLLTENVNIEIIVVQPPAEETSIEHSSSSNETSLCINDSTNSQGTVQTVNAFGKSAEKNISNEAHKSRETSDNTSRGLKNDEKPTTVRNSKEVTVNHVPTVKSSGENSALKNNAKSLKEESKKNSQPETDRNSDKTLSSDKGLKVSTGTVGNLKKESINQLSIKERPCDPNEKLKEDSVTVENSQKLQNLKKKSKEAFLSRNTDSHKKDSKKNESVRNSETVQSPVAKLKRAVTPEIGMNSKKDKCSASQMKSKHGSPPKGTQNNSTCNSKRSLDLGKPVSTVEKIAKPTTSVDVIPLMKESIVHIPFQNSSKSENTTPVPADKNLKKRQKRAYSELFVPSNVKERSVRSRKKLILPDFEYALDSKFEKDDSTDQLFTSSAPKNRSLIEKSTAETESPNPTEKIVRKRGRPRKVIETPKIIPSPSTSGTKSSSDISEKTTTVPSAPESAANIDEKTTEVVTSTAKSTSANEEEVALVISADKSEPSVDKVTIPDTSVEESAANVENARPAESSLKTNIDDAKAAPTTSVTTSMTNINEDTEVFTLTTMMEESDHDISMDAKNGDGTLGNDADESWLKKLDFSEGQSLTDSWNDVPKKKLGRPPKRKKVESATAKKSSVIIDESKEGVSRVEKNDEVSTELPPQGERKKRGRPRKVVTTPTDDASPSNVRGKGVTPPEDPTQKIELPPKTTIELISSVEKQKTVEKETTKRQPNETSQNESDKMKHLDAILDSVVAIKKRGRPPKPRPSVSTQSESTYSVPPKQKPSISTQSESNNSVPSKQRPSISTQSESNNSVPEEAVKDTGPVSEKEMQTASSPIAVTSTDVSNPTVNGIKENESVEKKNEIPETSTVVRKKRGRPKKSVVIEELKNLERSSPIENKVESDNEVKEPAEDTVEDINVKKKREFMEYIRIKEDTDDSEHKLGKKVDNTYSSVSPPKKRGRPRLDEVAKKRAAAAELAKNDRPYSIYNKYNAASDLKRRRNPLQTLDLLKIKRNKRRKLMDDAKRSENTSASETANDSSAFLSDSSTADDGAVLNNDDLPYVVKKFGQKRVKKLNKVKVKKSRDVSPSTEDAKQDETKNIDPELYSADMKNRAKYSRIFRKVREVPKHDEYFPNSLVTCGRCKKLMTLRHYHLYHQISHYFLCWLDGEKELDFSVDTDLIRIMQQYVNPDALRKKLVKLHCEQCHKIMKSVVGYVSHIRFCSKMNEEEFLGTCVLCGKKLKPSSLRHHYVKTHNIALPNVNAKTREELFLPVPETSSKHDLAGSASFSSTHARKVPKSFMNFERKPIDKSDIINDEEFWTTVKTSYDLFMCMGLSCKHMTLSKDDLKNHILNCSTAFCEFKCTVCPFITRYESEIIYHTKNACKDFSDSEDKVDEEVDKSVTEGRRVSNRVKKRKYRYDEEFFDNESKKAKGDDDFHVSNEDEDDEAESPDDSDYDSDEEIRTKSRSSKRKSGLYSTHGSDSSLRVAFLNHDSTRQYDPLNWTVETRQKICNASPILEELKVNLSAWGLTSMLNVKEHMPKQVKSMKIASENKTFVDYSLFQSEVTKGVPICFVGGPVWALAWAPLPAHISEQFLAVAGLQHMNHLIELSSSVEFPSLIQIWRYPSLDNISNAIDQPVLDMAIAHKYGAVSCMEWCPSGGFDSRPNACRLGILAVATSAGCVVVYSVPKLDSSEEPTNRIACPEPDLILKVACDNIQCTRVVWLRKKEQGVICGGFSNGTIALWNISSKSSLLRDGNKVYPYRTFEAHNASILALDAHWLDNGRYLLTSSIDRVMKYWDLEDLSGPLNEQEGSSPIVNVVWLQQWAVSALGIDSSNVVDASAVLSHSRDTIEKKKSISSLRDTCWSIAYSDWNDTVALSLCSGQVSVFAAKHMSTLTFKQPDFEKVVTETSLIPLNDDDKDSPEKESIEDLTGLPETKSSYDCTSVLQEFALQFCDRVKNKTPSTKSGFTPDCCNVMSINKVCWNQNYNSFNWLAVGYESGFVRIFRVERFDKLHLTKFYKMNENSNVNSI